MRFRVLSAILLGFLFLVCAVSCNENQVLEELQTPAIRGSVSIPAGANVKGSDFFIRIMEGEKAVYTPFGYSGI